MSLLPLNPKEASDEVVFSYCMLTCLYYTFGKTQGFEAYVGLQLLRTALTGVVAEWQVY